MTIRDVAAKAGVAMSTVSMALRNDPRVAAPTRDLVQQAATQLGYRPRQRGRPALGTAGERTRRTHRIALLVPGMAAGVLNSPVYMDVLHGVESALSANQRMCVLRHLSPDLPVPVVLFPQRVDGVVLFGPARAAAIEAQLRLLPCVQMMGVAQRGLPWDQVTYDNDAVGELAARYLLERGHRNLAMLAPPGTPGPLLPDGIYMGRREGFRRVAEAAGATVRLLWDEPLHRVTATHQETVPETLARIIDQLQAASPRPSALFCPADMLMAGLYPLLVARGLVPSRDLELVSCNNEALLLQNLHPRPATVDIHAREVGRRAVEQLLWRLEHADAPRGTVTLDPTLVPPQP